MGRVLVLDDFINIYDKEMEDQYTLDLPRHVTMRAEKQELENVLIIGGGDCLVANHMLRRFPNIKKVTMCEIDRRVVENV
jgi:spermidine synthase